MTQEVQVRFFGNLAHLAGGRTRSIRIQGGRPTVGELRAAVAEQVPEVAPHLHHTAIGAGTELLEEDEPLPVDTEIALLPPVSGGMGMAERIQDGPLDLDALIRGTEGVDDGALVVFAGNVRARDRGAEISALDYDVHREMAEKVIRDIERDLEAREGVLACRIVHRVGVVPAGEPSVYVVVRGRHRPEAFEAARDGIDRVKAEAPIWKEDVHPSGERRPHSGEEGTPLRARSEEREEAGPGSGSP